MRTYQKPHARQTEGGDAAITPLGPTTNRRPTHEDADFRLVTRGIHAAFLTLTVDRSAFQGGDDLKCGAVDVGQESITRIFLARAGRSPSLS